MIDAQMIGFCVQPSGGGSVGGGGGADAAVVDGIYKEIYGETIEQIEYNSTNRLNPERLTDGLVSDTDGTVVPTDNRVTSDYIQFRSGEYYRLCYWDEAQDRYVNTAMYGIAFYDLDKNFVGTMECSSVGQIIFDGAEYLRVSYVPSSQVMMVFKGWGLPVSTDISSYIAYSETVTTVQSGGLLEDVSKLKEEVASLKNQVGTT